jgi:hypothetical protein
MMNTATGGDADCFLHVPRTIAGFTDLKVVLFENSPLQSIPSAINACCNVQRMEGAAASSNAANVRMGPHGD